MLTSKGEESINEKALKAGAADYITKDRVNTEVLERSVRYATTQFEMLEKLKRNEHTFRVLFERSKDAIIISTPSGQILDANRSALSFFGVNYADMEDINTAFFYRHSSQRQSFVRVLQRDGAINETLLEILTLNGDVRTCCVSSFIEIPQHGQTELFYTFIKEVKESHPQFQHSATPSSSHVLRDRFSRSVRAVRTSLSKINQTIETELDPEAYARDTSLFDAIRMNASFADQALQTLEEECRD